MQVEVNLPRAFVSVFSKPLGFYSYRCLVGGRGSGKSFNCALMILVYAYQNPIRVLCAREFQVSIRESFYAELVSALEKNKWLQPFFEVTKDFIRGRNGAYFFFKGLRNNTQSLKSIAGIDVTIVEEAEDVPEASWLALEATIFRKPKSELWAIWNPKKENSPVDRRFIKYNNPNAIVKKVNYYDNPYFPTGLETLRLRDLEFLDRNTYKWIWEGDYLKNSDSQVFADKYVVQEFDIDEKEHRPYIGLDFGFSIDPTACVQCHVINQKLYIYKEVYIKHLELDLTPTAIHRAIPLSKKYPVIADCSRPESISYLKRKGLPYIKACKKWSGSVEDGIAFMKAFKKIIIHPRCTYTLHEFDLYSFKVDRHTNEILPQIIDANNHIIDAIRYSLDGLITKGRYNSDGMVKL